MRACSDAYIALSSPNKKIITELGRNNNTQSCIQVYPQGERSAPASEPVLDCRKCALGRQSNPCEEKRPNAR